MILNAWALLGGFTRLDVCPSGALCAGIWSRKSILADVMMRDSRIEDRPI
jgi:hypothetical protein